MAGGATPRALTQGRAINMEPASSLYAIDIGGTWLRSASWSKARGANNVQRFRTPSLTNFPLADPGTLIDALAERIARVPPKGDGLRVGISLGAALDHRTGTIYGSAPLWGSALNEVPLLRLIQERRPDVHWTIVNDVTAMLMAYHDRHPELRAKKVLLTTVSTGIAARTLDSGTGAVPLDGAGLQGEIGHLPASTEGDLHLHCACGVLDHVAAYSSGPGIRNVASALLGGAPNDPTAPALSSASRESNFEAAFAAALSGGESHATEVLRVATRPMADAFTSALTLDPTIDQIVLTGGVIDSIGLAYRAALLKRMISNGMYYTAIHRPSWVADRIVLATGDETSALLGAALAANQSSDELES